MCYKNIGHHFICLYIICFIAKINETSPDLTGFADDLLKLHHEQPQYEKVVLAFGGNAY